MEEVTQAVTRGATAGPVEPADRSAASLARASLRYLAERHLPPTPDQYRRAWRCVGGSPVEADAACGASGASQAGGAAAGMPTVQLISDLLCLLEAPHRSWTRARKRQSLERLLANHRSDATRLPERLAALLELWKADDAQGGDLEPCAATRSEGLAVHEAPATGEAAAASAIGACGPQGLRALLAEMTRLLVTICETVPTLVEEEAWVRRQFDAIRATLDAAGTPDRRELSRARDVLRRTAEEHQRLLRMRRDSLQMMKTMIAQCIEWLRALTESSDRYGDKLGAYIERIQDSPDLPTLAGTVRELIEDTRAICARFDESRHDFATASERARQLEQEVDRLAQDLASASELVMTDHLTNLLNRRGLERSFDELAGRCRDAGRRLSLALLDVDDFKRINDVLGHQAGDEALAHLGSLLRAALQAGDLGARYGGEEFVVLIADVDPEQAAAAMRHVQRALATRVLMHCDERVVVTFSAGVAQVRAGETLTQAVVRADRAMYQAKRSGKNRVHLASPP